MSPVDLTLAALAACLPLGLVLAYLAGRTRGWTRPDRRVGHVCTGCHVTSYFPASTPPSTVEAHMVHRPDCHLNPVPGGLSIVRDGVDFSLELNDDERRTARDWNGHRPAD